MLAVNDTRVNHLARGSAMQVLANTLTGDTRIDALLASAHWDLSNSGAITYSFPTASSTWSTAAGEYTGTSTQPFSGLAALTSAQQDAVRSALSAWATVAKPSFAEVTDAGATQGTLRFAWTTGLDATYQSDAFTPGTANKAGDVWLNTQALWDGFTPGTYGYSTLLHEIGHALGLKDTSVTTPTLPTAQDGYANTLMSYNAFAGSAGSWVDFEPTTPMLYDVLAIQALYGANTGWQTGNNTYTFAQGSRYFQTIWDAGGTDTLRWNAASQAATIDLRPGHFSTLGDPLTYWNADLTSAWSDPNTVAIAFGVTIENIIAGEGADTLIGNDAWNTFTGNGGNDTITGGAGIDTAVYAGTRSQYTVTHQADGSVTVSALSGAEGTDSLIEVERATFSNITLGFDVNGTGGQAYRLYQAAFDRVPDRPGLGFWMYFLDTGWNLSTLADNFMTGSEFIGIYGTNPTPEQYVPLLYQHVHHRAPDLPGLQFWIDAMHNTGGIYGHAWSRGEILVLFSESPENKANLVGVMQDGFEYTPFTP